MHRYERGKFSKSFSNARTSVWGAFQHSIRLVVQLCQDVTLLKKLSDCNTKSFLSTNGIQNIDISQYPKGNSSLGGMVENCVKQCKRLIYGSIRNNIVNG